MRYGDCGLVQLPNRCISCASGRRGGKPPYLVPHNGEVRKYSGTGFNSVEPHVYETDNDFKSNA